MKKKIFLISVNRSDYGIQKNLILALQKDKNIDFSLLITGAHLKKNFGMTKNEILEDNIKILDEINFDIKNYSKTSVLNYISFAIKKFSLIYKKQKPDLIIILGDRYEMLAAAIPTIILNIPVAHIHGGETTLGSFDDTIRNCITQISTLHFVCHEKYKKRVEKIKNNKKLIYNVGSLSVEKIFDNNFFEQSFLEKKFNIKFKKKNILVTFHPITNCSTSSLKYLKNIFKAIKSFKDIQFIFTTPAPDPGNKKFIENIKIQSKKNSNIVFVKSFGRKYYFSVVKKVDAVMGNSSSGIIEIPSFKIPTINIGNRQEGRIFCSSIVNSSYNSNDIKKNIKYIFKPDFQKKVMKVKNIFYKKNTLKNIINYLKKYLELN
jgi:UDP-hydrolysing UDP-N-acetyl-D-glucosamine 2-epimerase